MLIVHHWDTDGICSAAKLKNILKPENLETISPPIGDFTFDERIMDAIERHDEIFVVDLNLPHIVEKIEKKMTFIDHHHQPRIENKLVKQINPILEGRSTSDLPSATAVISDIYNDWNILSLLGSVGDIGEKAYANEKNMTLLRETGWSKDDIKKLVTLIDSNYIAMDQKGVEEAVRIMHESDPKDLLLHKPWLDNLKRIETAIEETLQNIESVNGFAYMLIDCQYNIISKLARRATWEMGYPGAIVLNRGFNGRAQTYFRVNDKISDLLNMTELIDNLKDIGINAGGKKVVMGSIYSIDRIDEVMEMVCETAGFSGSS